MGNELSSYTAMRNTATSRPNNREVEKSDKGKLTATNKPTSSLTHPPQPPPPPQQPLSWKKISGANTLRGSETPLSPYWSQKLLSPLSSPPTTYQHPKPTSFSSDQTENREMSVYTKKIRDFSGHEYALEEGEGADGSGPAGVGEFSGALRQRPSKLTHSLETSVFPNSQLTGRGDAIEKARYVARCAVDREFQHQNEELYDVRGERIDAGTEKRGNGNTTSTSGNRCCVARFRPDSLYGQKMKWTTGSDGFGRDGTRETLAACRTRGRQTESWRAHVPTHCTQGFVQEKIPYPSIRSEYKQLCKPLARSRLEQYERESSTLLHQLELNTENRRQSWQ